MKALQLVQPSASPDAIQVSTFTQQMPTCGPTEAVVRVLMAAVNPSDVKASLGHMPQAVFPRTPGRDTLASLSKGPKPGLVKRSLVQVVMSVLRAMAVMRLTWYCRNAPC